VQSPGAVLLHLSVCYQLKTRAVLSGLLILGIHATSLPQCVSIVMMMAV
jgi:hypothetical protein